MSELYHAVQLPLFVLSKICTKCHVEKPVEAFYRTKKGYLSSQCKGCICAEMQDRYAATHPPKPVARIGYKFCSTCGIEKSLDEFSHSKRSKDEHSGVCKACTNTRNAENRYKRGERKRPVPLPPAINGGKVCTKCRTEKPFTEFSRETRNRDGYSHWCKECLYANHQHVYVTRYRDDKLMKNHLWYEENKAKHRAMMKEWDKAHPLVSIERTRRYVARKRQTMVDKVDYQTILERDGYWCYICEQSILPSQKIDFDHVIPLSRGGTHTEENIKATHRCCNRRKNDKLLSEMKPYQRRGPI